MRPKPFNAEATPSERVVKDIRRVTLRHLTAEAEATYYATLAQPSIAA